MPSFSHTLFQTLPVVGILRGLPKEHLKSIVEATVEGGLTNLEITMNTPGAAEQIRSAIEFAGGKLNIGAGTVTSVRLLEDAHAAGASFIVTPAISTDVIERCRQVNLPIFPGAFSPSEIQWAWELGATMVKVFPAEVLGPEYFQRIKANLPAVQLMPTGGVDVMSLGSFARAGAAGFGVGSPLFRAERIAAADWDWLRKQSRAFAEAYRATQTTEGPPMNDCDGDNGVASNRGPLRHPSN